MEKRLSDKGSLFFVALGYVVVVLSAFRRREKRVYASNALIINGACACFSDKKHDFGILFVGEILLLAVTLPSKIRRDCS